MATKGISMGQPAVRLSGWNSEHGHVRERLRLAVCGTCGGTGQEEVQPEGALAATPPLEPTPEYLEWLAAESQRLERAEPAEILRWAVEQYAPRFTMATAFGPEGMVLIHMLSELAPETPIFNLDTGYQFPETLAMVERVWERYGIRVELKRPELSVEQYEAANGGPVYKTDPDRCCFDRKIRVLRQAVRGMYAWASAIRRDQSPDRARAPIVGWDRKFQLVKVSPLANWTKKDVWAMITRHNIPYNPLHDQGYASIGCWPCTRPILFGEDERAGRWSGTGKIECGLHSLDDPQSNQYTGRGPATGAGL
ncbi:MAG: phosphoadenylyl-sulfate reductase [Pirellulaceae bacterium]|nr:MAG: phosphoadenylyl-sulfate reductase [Pirellulaceae bacterium]